MGDSLVEDRQTVTQRPRLTRKVRRGIDELLRETDESVFRGAELNGSRRSDYARALEYLRRLVEWHESHKPAPP